MKNILIPFLIGFTVSTASAVERDDRAYIHSGSIWENPIINVCWENPVVQNQTQRAWVRDSVETSWQAHSSLQFVGWGQCSRGSKGIRIRISDEQPHVKKLGNYLNGHKNGIVLNFTFNNWSESCRGRLEHCIKAIAIHEFGHAIGFSHEHNRPDTPSHCKDEPQGTNGDVLVGNWDTYSIMNYCAPQWNNGGSLSNGDMDAVQLYYSFNEAPTKETWLSHSLSPYAPTSKLISGDFNGDGKDDFLRIPGPVLTYKSNGASFVSTSWKTKLPTSAKEYLEGDFNNDGKSDLGVIRDNYGSRVLDIHQSTGSGFTIKNSKTNFGNPAYIGTHKYTVGDFNGDGYDDIATITPGFIDVYLYDGSNFSKQRWVNYPSRTIETALSGDFDGDGKSDILTIEPQLINPGYGSATLRVFSSKGNGFSENIWANGSGFNISSTWGVGDYNNDSRDDVAYSDGSGSYVYLSCDTVKFCRRLWTKSIDQRNQSSGIISGDFDGNGFHDFMGVGKPSTSSNLIYSVSRIK